MFIKWIFHNVKMAFCTVLQFTVFISVLIPNLCPTVPTKGMGLDNYFEMIFGFKPNDHQIRSLSLLTRTQSDLDRNIWPGPHPNVHTATSQKCNSKISVQPT